MKTFYTELAGQLYGQSHEDKVNRPEKTFRESVQSVLAEQALQRAINQTKVAREYDRLRIEAMELAQSALASLDCCDIPDGEKLRLKSLWLDEFMKDSL